MKEFLKKKKEARKFYIQILKKSGHGYKINYAPGCKDR